LLPENKAKKTYTLKTSPANFYLAMLPGIARIRYMLPLLALAMRRKRDLPPEQFTGNDFILHSITRIRLAIKKMRVQVHHLSSRYP
jgi:hypothetical protein